MEIHAIWTRIDQLEKLILSQAKEIDMLRRIVNTVQITLQNNGIVQSIYKNNGIIPNHVPPLLSHNRQDNLSSALNRNSTPQPAYKTYMMNPFVHPASAIPPVANRVIMTHETSYPMNGTNNINGLLTHSRTLPAIHNNNRLSAGPTLLHKMPDVDNDKEESPRKRNVKYCLVELITCFCPCFSMC